MGLLSWLGRVTGVSELRAALDREDVIGHSKSDEIEAAYAAARTNGADDLYELADSLNANAANSQPVRRTIRERARNACENNGPVEGLVKRIAKDMVGRVPRPRITADRQHRKATRRVERLFGSWAKEACLGEKLRLLTRTKIVDGEGFAVLVNNPKFSAVQLDLRLFEADQVTTPFLNNFQDLKAFDGGRLDDYGNVAEWHFLKAHPGSDLWISSILETEKVEAKRVIQWFEPTRPGQLRGVSEIASSLTIFGYIRRYALATVKAAEMASCLAGVMETDQDPADPADDEEETPSPKVMDRIRLLAGTLLTLPNKWRASQFKPEQPTANYSQFKSDLMTDGGAPLGAPKCVSVNSAADYNFSAAQLDTKQYQQMLGVSRHDFANRVLNRIFAAWLAEAKLIPGYLPKDMPSEWECDWFFDGFPSADPVKDATAEDIRLKNGTTTLDEIYADWGQDWQEQLEKRAEELEYSRELGIDAAMAASGPAARPQFNDAGDQVGATTADAAVAGGGVQNTALNGAQVTSLMMIVDKVAAKAYPPETGIALIRAAFPLMSSALINEFIKPLLNYTPPATTQETANA